MKRLVLFLFLFPMSTFFCYSQQVNTLNVYDWNTIRGSGFYESFGAHSLNAPGSADWYWGINVGHTLNNVLDSYHYNGQIAFAVNYYASSIPVMHIRSTTDLGQGLWAKVLHDLGDQTINGNLTVKNPSSYPFGINLDTDTPSHWVREFNFTHNKEKNMFSLGTYADDDQLIYGYLGGGETNNANYQSPWMVFRPFGYIGIGTRDPQSKLDVRGKIIAHEVEVKIQSGADFVFQPDYRLPPLSEVEAFIQQNKHLPEIPSEKQMQTEGLNVNEMQIKLLQKVEELTLYVIDLKKENEKLQSRIETLEQKN